MVLGCVRQEIKGVSEQRSDRICMKGPAYGFSKRHSGGNTITEDSVRRPLLSESDRWWYSAPERFMWMGLSTVGIGVSKEGITESTHERTVKVRGIQRCPQGFGLSKEMDESWHSWMGEVMGIGVMDRGSGPQFFERYIWIGPEYWRCKWLDWVGNWTCEPGLEGKIGLEILMCDSSLI